MPNREKQCASPQQAQGCAYNDGSSIVVGRDHGSCHGCGHGCGCDCDCDRVVIAIVVVSVVVIVGGVVLWFLCLVEVYVDVDCGGDAGINYASRAVASPFRADFAEHCVQIALLPLD